MSKITVPLISSKFYALDYDFKFLVNSLILCLSSSEFRLLNESLEQPSEATVFSQRIVDTAARC